MYIGGGLKCNASVAAQGKDLLHEGTVLMLETSTVAKVGLLLKMAAPHLFLLCDGEMSVRTYKTRARKPWPVVAPNPHPPYELCII